MSNEKKLLPQVPVLTEYVQVKEELQTRIDKLNAIEYLTEENQKEVKNDIAAINKVKDRIARFRIDNTNEFLKYIEPYVAQCKELEKMCTDGVAAIKSKVAELEEKERNQKKETLLKLFEFHRDFICAKYKNLLKFDMFFEKSMSNKTTSINVVENELKVWLNAKHDDLSFIENNTDEPDSIMQIYLENGLNLTKSIQIYQDRFKNEAEIKAMIASEASNNNNIEKKLNLRITIRQLPKSKAAALQTFLDCSGVEYDVEVL